MTLHVAGGWPIISSNIFKFDHNYSVKGGLKVFDCIVQSAEYWHPYGTKKEGKKRRFIVLTLQGRNGGTFPARIWKKR